MENENAFKNLINENVVRKMGRAIKKYDASFPDKKFEKLIPELSSKELKDRVKLIAHNLAVHFKNDYCTNIEIIKKVIQKENLSGFELWPFSEYISHYGLDNFDESLDAMYVLTQKFTAEFAVRPFIIKDHAKVLNFFQKNIKDNNFHIRRWISEGSRPLLPWGQKILLFIDRPELTMGLLEQLKYDEEMYVRKSVANHLNDISKNHPQLVIQCLNSWIKEAPLEQKSKINWIKRHALRTLIKKGHEGALKLMGVNGKPKVKVYNFKLDKKLYRLNDKLTYSFELYSQSRLKQVLIVDYGIDFVKANGKHGRKIFKLKTFELAAGETILLKKTHSLKPITTMKYYPGKHHLTLQINGVVIHEEVFHLKLM